MIRFGSVVKLEYVVTGMLEFMVTAMLESVVTCILESVVRDRSYFIVVSFQMLTTNSCLLITFCFHNSLKHIFLNFVKLDLS